MLAPKSKKKRTLKNLFKKNGKNEDDEAMDASLMRVDRKRSSKYVQFDQDQMEMLEKLYDYHGVDMQRLRQKFKKNHQFDAFIRKNQNNIDNARTASMVILGTSGSGKTKVWWNFLNYFRKSYLDSNSWGLSPKDFYYIITEKIMNISIDILIEYNHHRKKIEDPNCKDDPPSTCLSKNDLVKHKEFKLELEEDEDVKEGYDFFQDLISKLEKIAVAISANVQIEEKKKMEGAKPNWDKIQELRNIEKEIKEFTPSMAPKIRQLWKSQQLRNMYLYQYGLHSSRNLFYYIDNINKFVMQKLGSEPPSDVMSDGALSDPETADDDEPLPLNTATSYNPVSHDGLSSQYDHVEKKKAKWQWEWSFEEILRCQIRTTGVIEQCTNLGPNYDNDTEKNFNLRLRLWDVGGAQNERKKWKYILNTKEDAPDIDCIIFVVNLMSYYKKSWESDKNGLLQSLQLFSCLLSQGDMEHDEKFHRINFGVNSTDDEKAQNDVMPDHMALVRSISQEEYNTCIDHQVKRAINDISLFYIIFSDTEGLEQMLKEGISFKTCFPDYDGDNSVVDVHQFIEQKFQKVVEESNQRTAAKNGQVFKKRSSVSKGDEMKPYIMRTGSLGKNLGDTLDAADKAKAALKKTQTSPNVMNASTDKQLVDDNEEFSRSDDFSDQNKEIDGKMHSIIEPDEQIEGLKRVKCRFVSVINHDEMKSVMNEIVRSSFMCKNALNPVLHSLIDE
mmetsp:Transcript_58398/g.92822  ORF Transcript_58398/g.92822 Transcript_58398/m.92822 type:complete len:728 (-) Transcript_58398:184-2367(-)|eukprot:CAMPEP_0197031782 /NCGR_PEP_ID=MMETSP1384-20130603/10671_1 /TAXON_ID=29189 /ORGANISM="Ammonia sp." /LENGTH=727 /DNA_ID=CAMNT_0042461357 /DNA_START=39 /DNA_END=2222 /DNA_ORIENTATION=+